jgi:uncharacterized membrane protein
MNPTPPARTHPNPAARNVEEIARLERDTAGRLPLGERISIATTNTIGTFTVAVLHLLLFASWMTWNSAAPEGWRFDPYPYGLLTMAVSMEGVLLATLVLITQNRMSRQSDQREHLDLQVDLLAEQEMTMVLRMLGRISDKLGVAPDHPEREEARQMMEGTNIYELMEELRRKI